MINMRLRWTQSLEEIRKDPFLWGSTAFVQIVVVWAQDVIPFAGTVIASIFTVFLAARLFDRAWKLKWPILAILGVFHFPLTAVWPILSSFFQNGQWVNAFSLAWSIPALFFLCIGEVVVMGTVKFLLKNENLDRSLTLAWKALLPQWKQVFLFAILGSLGFAVSLATQGVLFVFTVPIGFAIAQNYFLETPLERPELKLFRRD